MIRSLEALQFAFAVFDVLLNGSLTGFFGRIALMADFFAAVFVL